MKNMLSSWNVGGMATRQNIARREIWKRPSWPISSRISSTDLPISKKGKAVIVRTKCSKNKTYLIDNIISIQWLLLRSHVCRTCTLVHYLSLGCSMVWASHKSSEGCGFDPRLGLTNRFFEDRAWRSFICHSFNHYCDWYVRSSTYRQLQIIQHKTDCLWGLYLF